MHDYAGTDWATRSMTETATTIDDYADTVGARKQLIKTVADSLPAAPPPRSEPH